MATGGQWLLLACSVLMLSACSGGSQAGERPLATTGNAPTPSSISPAETSPAPLAAEVPPAPVAPIADMPETMALAATTADADLLSPVPQGDHQGAFRVGNQTPHPLRIAFLQRSAAGVASTDPPKNSSDTDSNISSNSSANSSKDSGANGSSNGSAEPTTAVTAASPIDLEPIHWDFAPGEGGQSGLLLSVPQGDIELHDGDVLVAFAQDGSRRYWGPYVVGQTQLPYWNQERSEWQLLIQP